MGGFKPELTKGNRKRKRYICFVLALLMAAGLLSGCGVNRVEYNSFEDLQNAGNRITIGFDESLGVIDRVHNMFPEAGVAYYSLMNGFRAVQSGKIDAYIADSLTMQTAIGNGMSGIKALDEAFMTNDVVCALSDQCEIPDFKNRVNSFIAKVRADGTVDDIYQRWVYDRNYEMPEIPEAEDPEYTLTVTTMGSAKPFSFYQDGELVGSEIEFAYLLAKELNAKVVFEVASWSGMLTGVSLGKYDICIANLYYSEEKAKLVTLTEPYYQSDLKLVVQDFQEETGSAGNRLIKGFENTLIVGNRWKMMLRGLGVTMVITLGGFALANVLGAGLCAMALSRRKALRALENIYSKIMQGMPHVVALMILYYILFSDIKVSGILIAVIAFGLTGAAHMSQLFAMGLRCVSAGQREAALAMGAGKGKVFREIVFPQAAVNALPGYFSQIISMMKGTAVVGYIAVVDLTKASDVIRGATFDAITPLLTTALVYILMSALLISVMNGILKKISPKLRKRVLKGVKLS